MHVPCMEHPRTSFRRSFAVSSAIHILIFGTALAFAHYGELIFGGDSRVITVALVGGDDRAAASSGTMRPARRPTVPRPALRESPEMPVLNAEKDVTIPSADPGTAEGGDSELGTSVASTSRAPGVVAGDGSGGPAGLLSPDQWRLLQSAIEKAKNYPRLARERGVEGVVLVRFRVLPSGAVDEVDVVKSSGAAILDEASVKTVRRAGPMPYVNGWIEVPMVYELR